MTIHLRNLEWLDHNSQRSYPIAVEATKQDVSASFTIPDEFIVGMYLAIHVGVNTDPTKYFIKNIGNHSTGFGITIGYDAAGGAINVATANIARASHTENQSYRLTGIGDFIDATGVIALGSLDAIGDQPAGSFDFTPDGARLDTDVIKPLIRTISSIRVQNGPTLSDHIYGTPVIEAGTNMRITVVAVAGEDTRIVFDAIEGEGLNEVCVCEDDVEAPALRTINGIPGTVAGDFTILGNSCLVPTGITNGIRLDDVCSEPCCGCEELEIVTAQLEQFGRQATTLENFLVDLQARVTEMDMVVLGARLGDRGCVTCE